MASLYQLVLMQTLPFSLNSSRSLVFTPSSTYLTGALKLPLNFCFPRPNKSSFFHEIGCPFLWLFYRPFLHLLQCEFIFLEHEWQELQTVYQIKFHQSLVKWHIYFPICTRTTSADTPQFHVCFFCGGRILAMLVWSQ